MASLRNKLIHLSIILLLSSLSSRSTSAFSSPLHRHNGWLSHRYRTMSLHQTTPVIDDAATSPSPSPSSSSFSSSIDRMNELANEMNKLAKEEKPFTTHELDEIMASLVDVLPPPSPPPSPSSTVRPNLPAIRSLFEEVGHLPYTDWDKTSDSASRLRHLLLGEEEEGDEKGGGLTNEFRGMFHRILTEGNWDAAASSSSPAASSSKDERPWAVLVTGLNGIRKSTSVYQPWFEEVLREAIAAPPTNDDGGAATIERLPTGQNSFFRQLDHMIATLVNRRFRTLYVLTSQSPYFSNTTTTTNNNNNTDATTLSSSSSSLPPPNELISAYSNLKAAIFSRYRTLSEILGILLVREARKLRSNVMVETSGRSVGMFHYVDAFFPPEEYRKLVLRFTIDDRSLAEDSVDKRMVKEMRNGIGVLQEGGDGGGGGKEEKRVREMIRANLGGPYGSEVLKGVQEDSDRVWETMVVGVGKDSASSGVVGGDWYKACIEIRTNPKDEDGDRNKDDGWTANAIRGTDGSQGTVYEFEPPRR